MVEFFNVQIERAILSCLIKDNDFFIKMSKKGIPNSKVFFVTPRSRYFAGAPYAGRGHDYWDYAQKAIADGTIYQYDYLAINIDMDERFAARKKILYEQLPQYTISKEFYGLRNKKKMILFEKTD